MFYKSHIKCILVAGFVIITGLGSMFYSGIGMNTYADKKKSILISKFENANSSFQGNIRKWIIWLT